MKILITTDLYRPTINGVISSVLNLRAGLEEAGHEVRILTLDQGKDAEKEEGVYYVPSISAGKIYPTARILRALGRREVEDIVEWKPDIIHSQCEFSTFILAKRISGLLHIPIVHTYHTVYEDYTHYFSFNRSIGQTLARKFSSFISKRTDGVIVPTEKIRRLLLSYGVTQDIYTIPSGLDLERFQEKTSEEDRILLKKKHGIPLDKKVVLFLGRVAKEKNVQEILEYLKGMKREDFVFVIVGDGPYHETLQEEAKELGEKVIFTGMVTREEVPAYYKLGDIFVSASTSETQGLTYIEALSSGLPALCREDPCLEGVILEGKNGWQFRGREEFEEKLNSFLDAGEAEVQSWKKEALLVASAYSKENFASSVLAVYDKVLNKDDTDGEERTA